MRPPIINQCSGERHILVVLTPAYQSGGWFKTRCVHSSFVELAKIAFSANYLMVASLVNSEIVHALDSNNYALMRSHNGSKVTEA